jgi:hypothetical protein
VKGRKRHLATDTLGLVLAVVITRANVQDRDAAEPVVAAAKSKYAALVKGWAGGGYSGETLEAIRANDDMDIEVGSPSTPKEIQSGKLRRQDRNGLNSAAPAVESWALDSSPTASWLRPTRTVRVCSQGEDFRWRSVPLSTDFSATG